MEMYGFVRSASDIQLRRNPTMHGQVARPDHATNTVRRIMLKQTTR